MAESIFVRVQRVVTGGLESAVDAAERASGTALMREAIRQVDRSADSVRRQIEAAKNKRLLASRQQQMVRKQLATLDEQARFALGKGRDDLAETAIARQIELEAEEARLKALQAEIGQEQARLESSLAELNVRHAQMEQEFKAFQAARRAVANGPGASTGAARKVARAEAAFDRAMAAAGGISVCNAGPEAAVKLAEIDAAQRDAAVADRLAALRKAQPARKGSRPKARKTSRG